MSEDRKNKQETGAERKSKGQPSQAAAPQAPQQIHVPEMQQMQQMQQMPQMQPTPHTIYTPHMSQMPGYPEYMPQMPLICCPYLMNIQCPMLQGDMYGTGYMQGSQYWPMQQPQFMYGSGMYMPFAGGDGMNCMQY